MSPYEGARLSVKQPARCPGASLFTVARLVDGPGGYPFALIFVRKLSSLSVGEFSRTRVSLPESELFR